MEMLNDMALFVEVVKAMSFRRASEATGVPNSTLSRRISALEKAIGLRLLHRTTRKIELTEAGQIYYDRCRRIVEEARLAHEALGDILAQPSGLLRASLPVDFAINYMVPLLIEFAEQYPDIRFEFDLTPRRVDLVTEPFDVAIRIGEQKDSNLIARLLANLPAHLYASPKYLEKHGEPSHPQELIQHQCLGFPRNGVWTLHNFDAEDKVEINVSGRFMLNNVGMIKRLAAFDQGIVLLPQEVVTEDLAEGLLHRILPQWQGVPVPVYALTETRLLPAKTQRFIEFLRDRMR
ncbi:LysR family transcriptional regulator [Budviciaceae bacterium CWB-B4]|uniref:LysR family transcriptional regulator n=1 Tax=Limnobaculum xujianqingii TaxID=2738837 RepID=A0A9D7FSW8_9GAMM|nr:LysR family transcriptional regulator [Limnobaculum xujianqingii]MBK5073004.1 LysR family transcriptional regulator [Limnobaculum xujianqingii]MBK5176313.1 LysR family transcriptional regulator [Limnobaculum xujianqingii]